MLFGARITRSLVAKKWQRWTSIKKSRPNVVRLKEAQYLLSCFSDVTEILIAQQIVPSNQQKNKVELEASKLAGNLRGEPLATYY